jgi:hypothetical protein
LTLRGYQLELFVPETVAPKGLIWVQFLGKMMVLWLKDIGYLFLEHPGPWVLECLLLLQIRTLLLDHLTAVYRIELFVPEIRRWYLKG